MTGASSPADPFTMLAAACDEYASADADLWAFKNSRDAVRLTDPDKARLETLRARRSNAYNLVVSWAVTAEAVRLGALDPAPEVG